MEDESFDFINYEERRKAADENMKTMEEETRTWMATNEKVKDYLNQFRETYSADFIKGYPALKARFVRFGNELGDQPEKREIAYLETASKRLMDIQLKKLFDVICQWDANIIKLEGVECSWDFLLWQEDMMNCPFVTPITREEVERYLRFANTADFNERINLDIIYYDSYRNEKEGYEAIPDWFTFENTYTGNDKYLLLPMLRTKKEYFYRMLWRKEEDEKLEKQYESGELKRYIPDNRPEISLHKYNDVERFIVTNESKDVLVAFKKHYAYFTDQLIREDPEEQKNGWLDEQVADIIHQLAGVKEKIPIEANSDWRQGLVDGFEKYEKRKIIEAIPYAFDDYNMMMDLKINKTKNKDSSYYSGLADNVRRQILRGRELNGEPLDFNY